MSLSAVMGVRAAGLLAGLCLVTVVALQAWRMPASPRAAGLEIELRAVPSGEVGVTPVGDVVGRAQLAPGGPAAHGRLRLANTTAQAIVASPLVTGGDASLDRVVEIELVTGGRVVFRGPLGGLRDVSTALPLARGGTADVAVKAWVPAAVGDAALARAGRWTLTFAEAQR